MKTSKEKYPELKYYSEGFADGYTNRCNRLRELDQMVRDMENRVSYLEDFSHERKTADSTKFLSGKSICSPEKPKNERQQLGLYNRKFSLLIDLISLAFFVGLIIWFLLS